MFVTKKNTVFAIGMFFSLHAVAQVIETTTENRPQLRFGHSSGNVTVSSTTSGTSASNSTDAGAGSDTATGGGTGSSGDAATPLSLVDIYNFNHNGGDSWLQGQQKIAHTPSLSNTSDCNIASVDNNIVQIRNNLDTNNCRMRFNFDPNTPSIGYDDHVSVTFLFDFTPVNSGDTYLSEIYITDFLSMGTSTLHEGRVVFRIYDNLFSLPAANITLSQVHQISIIKQGSEVTTSITNGDYEYSSTQTIPEGASFGYARIDTVAKNSTVTMHSLVIDHKTPE